MAEKDVIKDPIQLEDDKSTLERDERVVPIVKKILAVMGQEEGVLLGQMDIEGGPSSADFDSYYKDIVVKQIMPLFIEDDKITLDDVSYVFRLLLQPFQEIQDKVGQTLNYHYETETANKWGVNDVSEVTVKQLHEYLVEKQGVKPVDKEKGSEKK